jgi:hypothetical protein
MGDIQTKYDLLISTFIEWAQQQPDIRSARIIGSRTRNPSPSRWVDLDIEFYTTRPLYYRTNRTWIDEFFPSWLIGYDDTGDTLNHWSSRFSSWVLFTTLDEGIAVDFMVIPHIKLVWNNWKARARRTVSPVPNEHILVDKDGHLAKWGALPFPASQTLPKPSEEQFLWRVREFWGVADRGTCYLGREYNIEARRELGETLKKHTKFMLLWYAGATQNWQTNTDWRIHHIDDWADPTHLEAFKDCYARYDVDDVKRATRATMTLFRTVAVDVADLLNYTYPHDEDHLIATWIEAQFDLIN